MINRIVIEHLNGSTDPIDIIINNSIYEPSIVKEYKTETHLVKLYIDLGYFNNRFEEIRHDFINYLNNINGYAYLTKFENNNDNNDIERYSDSIIKIIDDSIKCARSSMNYDAFIKTKVSDLDPDHEPPSVNQKHSSAP